MALDGAYLRYLCYEINQKAVNSRVEKVYQPNKDEIVLALRNTDGANKLLLSARANNPRINFTQNAPENPKTPPMLCMLLRKKLCGSKLIKAFQPQMERILFLDFDAVNDFGEHVVLTLIIEIMGKYSNVIFTDGDKTIIDALKRVDLSMSSQRQILPALKYTMPPLQDKINILEGDTSAVTEKIIGELLFNAADVRLNKALLNTIQGVSPLLCRETEYLTGKGQSLTTHSMNEEQKRRLSFFLERMINQIKNCEGMPCMVITDGKPRDFSFINITQYGTLAEIKHYPSFSELTDAFYNERDTAERMKSKSQDLHRFLSTTIERLSRKINLQNAELQKCTDREPLRISGDLLQANLYRIQKGMAHITVENYYNDNKPITIALSPALTPSQNAQKYYKNYRKAKTAEQVLSVQIEKAQEELEYIETVLESLERAASESELAEIRLELIQQGYLKPPKGKQRKISALPPLQFTLSDGSVLLVGRNNRQNDTLTLKTAAKNDIWLHTKNIHGTHAILVTNGKTAAPEIITEAAQITAYHSKARNSSQVPVDYTLVKNVSKPSGAKPGMVIYVNNKTVYVTPKLPQK